MNTTVNIKELINGLSKVSRVLNNKTIPILENAYFKFENTEAVNLLTITGTNLEYTIEYVIKLNSEIKENISFLLNPKILLEFIKLLETEELKITFTHENYIIIESGLSSINITIDKEVDVFPKLIEIKENNKLTISNYSEFYNDINIAKDFVSNNEMRPVMNNINIKKLNDNTVDIVATNAYILYKTNVDYISFNSPNIDEIKLNPFFLSLLPKKYDKSITLLFDDKNVIINIENETIIGRLYEGKYPAYETIIPTNYTKELLIESEELHKSINEANLFVDKTSNSLNFNIINTNLLLSSNNDNDKYSKTLILNNKIEEEFSVNLQGKYMTTILSHLHDEIKIVYNNPSNALLISPSINNRELFLIMPLVK